MPRYRLITKYGTSYVVRLNPQDMKDMNLEEGDKMDIEEAEIIKKPVEIK